MKSIVSLSHFHSTIGPTIYYSYPEEPLNHKLSETIVKLMDQMFSEGFFTYSFENFYLMNYNLEIKSKWARGNKEILMLSIIFDKSLAENFKNIVFTLCIEFSEWLKSNKEMFKAFYKDELDYDTGANKEIILKNNSLLKLWVRELYFAVIEDIEEILEEENLNLLLNKDYIFSILKEIYRESKTLKNLKEWFINKYPDRNFYKTIRKLVQKEIIEINQIGRIENYISLSYEARVLTSTIYVINKLMKRKEKLIKKLIEKKKLKKENQEKKPIVSDLMT